MPGVPPYFIQDGPPKLVRLNTEDGHLNEDLRALCRIASEDQLHVYLDKTTVMYTNLRDIIQDEINRRRFRELKEPSRIDKWTFGFVIAGVVMSSIGIIISWLSWRNPLPPLGDKSSAQVSPIPQNSMLAQPKAPLRPAPPSTNSIAAPGSPKK
jgi:hypothetical protein